MGRVRARLPRAIGVAAVVIVLSMQIGTASAKPASPALDCTGDWSVIPSADPFSNGNTLSGVWAATATNAWAVGWGNGKSLSEHYTGGAWKAVPVPSVGKYNELDDVSGVSAKNVWAVGEYDKPGAHMLTEHWNGSAWTRVATPAVGDGARLEGVSSGTNRPTWAVGYYGLSAAQWATAILRLQKGKWVHVASQNPNPWTNQLYAVKSVSDTLGWAVGFSEDDDTDFHPLIERWNGSKWTAITDPAVVGVDGLLNAVATPTPTTMVAAGFGTGHGEMIVYYDGSTWTVSYPGPGQGDLYGITSDGAGGAWAVGREDPNDDEEDTLIEHGSESTYGRVTSPNPPGGDNALLGTMSRQGVTWAVGFQDSGEHTLIEYVC